MHQTTLEVYEDYDLTKEDPQTWEENILDNWHPVQLWPNILLPCDRPNIVTMTVTTLTSSTPATTQAGPSGPSTSTGTTGGVDSLKLAEIVKLQRQTFQILQDMGADTHGIDIQTEESTQVPIPIDSKVCPKCSKSFSSHYRAVLHYKYQHLIKPNGNVLYVIGILLQQLIWRHMKIVYMGHRIINAASVATTLSLKNTS